MYYKKNLPRGEHRQYYIYNQNDISYRVIILGNNTWDINIGYNKRQWPTNKRQSDKRTINKMDH